MPQLIERPFADQGAAGSTAALTGLHAISNKTVIVHGTFVATAQVEGSLDGGEWFNLGSSVTAPGAIEIAATVKQLRITVSGYTSGTVESALLGTDLTT
jgi:hypothetical protein